MPEDTQGLPSHAKIYTTIEGLAGAILDVFNNPRPCLVYVDETGDFLDTYGTYAKIPWHIKMLTRKGRHRGITVWMATQRPQDVPPKLRNQCKEWIAFRSGSETDAEIVAQRSIEKKIDGVPLKQKLLFLPNRTFYRMKEGVIEYLAS